MDPLNPLNLATIEPSKAPGLVGPDSKKELNDSAPARSSSLKLPLHLHLISDSKKEQFTETRKCILPCFMVSPFRNPDFVGRKDILTLMDENLLPSQTSDPGSVQSTRFFALCGMGGIGKTDLAVEYVHARRKHFDAVFWIEAGGVSQLASEFGRIATTLGLKAPEEADSLESNIEIAKAWLNASSSSVSGVDNNWLLVFDNADNLDIITDYVPYHANGSVLVTSRDPFAKEHFFSNGSGVDLEPLPATDSANLLRKLIAKPNLAESPDEQDASIELANHMDNLPLAMTQMAGFIRRRHLSIREFVNLYANDARYAEIHGIGNPAQERRYGNTLATAFNFEGLSSKATRLIQLLSYLNPDRVQEYMFVHGRQKGKKSLAWSPSDFDNARFELISCSLIKRNIEKKELWIHRVIQAEVRTSIEEEESRYQTFKDVVALISEVWPPGDHSSQKIQRWSVCEELLPHLERFYQLYIENSEAWDLFEVDVAFPALLNEAAV